MEIYKELGLTENEGKVFDALVKFGKLGAGEVSKHSGAPYSKIYTILDSLHGKGLVEEIPEKTKKFAPSNPEFLIKLIEKKQGDLERAREKAVEMKKFYDVKEKNPVVVKVGQKGFYKVVRELRSVEKYAYDVKWSSEFRPEFLGRVGRWLKGGKDIRVLARNDNETNKDLKKWVKVNKNIREIENDGVAMSVVDDAEVMISLIKSNVTLLVRDVPFAKVMKKMFLETYKNAKEVK